MRGRVGLASLAFALAATLAGAQSQPRAAAQPSSTRADRMLASLVTMSEDSCRVRYVFGALDRAAHVQTWLRELALGSASRTRNAMQLEALVLGREEWADLGLACPYGVPCGVRRGVVALPAAGDSGTVALWTGLLGGLPPIDGIPLMSTPEEAASLIPADAMAALVAARGLVETTGLVPEEPWMTDVLAHALALDAARHSAMHNHAWNADGIVAFWETVSVRFGPQGVPAKGDLAVELRRQAKLFHGAQGLIGSGGLPLKKLLSLQKKGGGVLHAADLRGMAAALADAGTPPPAR